jgi:hypothetical protein
MRQDLALEMLLDILDILYPVAAQHDVREDVKYSIKLGIELGNFEDTTEEIEKCAFWIYGDLEA